MVARLGCEAIALEVPMQVDLKFGRNWGDAKHTWQEVRGEIGHHVELAGGTPDSPKRIEREPAKFFNGFESAANFVPATESSKPSELRSEPRSKPDSELDSEPEIPPTHICARCKLDPPDGGERLSAYNDLWLHPRCENELLHERLAEENLLHPTVAATTDSDRPQTKEP